MLGNEFGLRLGDGGWKLAGDGPAGFHMDEGTYRDVGELMGPVHRALAPLGLELLTLVMDDNGVRAHVAFKRLGGPVAR